MIDALDIDRKDTIKFIFGDFQRCLYYQSPSFLKKYQNKKYTLIIERLWDYLVMIAGSCIVDHDINSPMQFLRLLQKIVPVLTTDHIAIHIRNGVRRGGYSSPPLIIDV